jgi:hypothetical protein
MNTLTFFINDGFACVKPHYGPHAVESALASGKITKRDRDLITEFIAERISSRSDLF